MLYFLVQSSVIMSPSATDEKYQDGESYSDQSKDPGYSLDDPVTIAKDVLNELANVRTQVTLPELIGIIKSLNEHPLDDKKLTTEALIGLLTSLSSKSKVRTFLTNKLIDTLWDNLQHPPLSYVGGDVKYEVVNPSNPKEPTKPSDEITFPSPDDPSIILREQVPPSPDGLYQYRMPDGSYNNILTPNLGRAGTAYAKSIRSGKTLHGVKPDPGLLFDLLMARDDKHFQENPAGVSAMLFYHASIIIHDIFRTSRTDQNISCTSSYLDLAPLYGSSLKDQLEIRTMKEGKLKPDTFHEKRLLGQPAGVNVMLVLYNRFHNYVVDKLLKINENGRFSLTCGPNASPEERAKAVAKQDHDLFNVGRLIVGGLYIEISLHDYLRAITNTHHSKSDWTLDPRVAIDKQFDGEGTPRGVGNQVSVEFNLLYRFHSCISKKDERWTNDFFLKLFPGRKAEDLENISWVELGQALVRYEQSIPADPSVREFSHLKRQADGTFKDEELVAVLTDAMKDPAGVFGARTVPKALKIVEILGIKQARKWQVASLNEFRDFFGLKRHKTFSDINSDPEIADLLEKLYTDPDMVELYPGLMIEDAKPVRNTGCGILPTYSLGRAILSDAVTLVRSDRFNTLEYNVANLTAWGYNEIQHDSKTLGGSMLYKLIQRGVPGWFPYNSVSVMQPMYTKQGNEKIAKELGILDQYSSSDPSPPPRTVSLSTSIAIRQALTNTSQFSIPPLTNLIDLFPSSPKKDLSWFLSPTEDPLLSTHRAYIEPSLSRIPNLPTTIRDFISLAGTKLITQQTFSLSPHLSQLDILRDVAIPLNAQLLADWFYLDLQTDENPTGSLTAVQLYRYLVDIRIWALSNNDPAQAWNRRRRAQEAVNALIPSTRKLVDAVSRSQGLGLGIASAITSAMSSLKKGSLRSAGHKLVEELLAEEEGSAERVVDKLWVTAFGGVGEPVTMFYEVLEFFLREENAAVWTAVQGLAEKGDDGGIREYVAEARRLTSQRRVVRVAVGEGSVEGGRIGKGDVVQLMLVSLGVFLVVCGRRS